VYLYLSVCVLVQTLTFQDVDGGHRGQFDLYGLLASCIRVLVVDLVEKVYLYLILAALVQNLISKKMVLAAILNQGAGFSFFYKRSR